MKTNNSDNENIELQFEMKIKQRKIVLFWSLYFAVSLFCIVALFLYFFSNRNPILKQEYFNSKPSYNEKEFENIDETGIESDFHLYMDLEVTDEIKN